MLVVVLSVFAVTWLPSMIMEIVRYHFKFIPKRKCNSSFQDIRESVCTLCHDKGGHGTAGVTAKPYPILMIPWVLFGIHKTIATQDMGWLGFHMPNHTLGTV